MKYITTPLFWLTAAFFMGCMLLWLGMIEVSDWFAEKAGENIIRIYDEDPMKAIRDCLWAIYQSRRNHDTQ